jgi:hypothetical protein
MQEKGNTLTRGMDSNHKQFSWFKATIYIMVVEKHVSFGFMTKIFSLFFNSILISIKFPLVLKN